MTSLDAYIRHADKFGEHGGLWSLWEEAWKDLDPVELGKLTVHLRAIRVGRRRKNGRTVPGEPFKLGPKAKVKFVERLKAAGVSDAEVCRYAGISKSKLGVVQRKGADPPKSPDLAPAPLGIIRNESPNTGNPARPDSRYGSRSCAWCSTPLPPTIRAGSQYCVGGACKQAAYRARRVEIDVAKTRSESEDRDDDVWGRLRALDFPFDGDHAAEVAWCRAAVAQGKIQRDAITEKLMAGMLIPHIAQEVGISQRRVYHYLSRHPDWGSREDDPWRLEDQERPDLHDLADFAHVPQGLSRNGFRGSTNPSISKDLIAFIALITLPSSSSVNPYVISKFAERVAV